MKHFTKQFPQKKLWLIFLLIAIVSAASYFTYDKFIAKKMVIASINPYNFTDVAVVDIYVNETWGGTSHPNSGGGSSVCCVLIPEKWRPGLVVNVKWLMDDNEKWHTAKTEIPPYAEPAGLQILFLENGKIKVYVNDYWPCTPMHPMPKDKNLCGETKKP